MIAEFIGIVGIVITAIGIIRFLFSLKNVEHDGHWKYNLATGISLIIISLVGKHFIILNNFIILNILKWVLKWIGIIGIIAAVIGVIRFLLSLKNAEHDDNRKEKI